MRIGLVAAGLPLAQCSGVQSALDPAGSGAGAIYDLWLLFAWICTAVFALVVGALLWALLRRRRTAAPSGEAERRALAEPDPPRTTRLMQAMAAATAAILALLTAASYAVGTGLFRPPSNAVEIEVTGHRWWWEARYRDGDIATANELHVPLGRPVALTLRSDDVIHSLWVPNLHGKMDLVPGQTNRLVFTAERPGAYRGQCAEFCGLQHAFMALLVVAEPAADFARWRARQQRPAPEPSTDAERRGRQVFADKCAACHTIRGFRSAGTLAPDLTHIASRTTLAAGRLPNSRGNRGGWIADAQALKPGVYMPPFPLPPRDLQALLSYLDTLE